MLQSASGWSWFQPADGVRRMLRNLVRRPRSAAASEAPGQLPAPDHVGRLAPDVAEAPRFIQERIEMLAASESLDEGTAGVLHPRIDSWVDQWAQRVEREHLAHQARLQLSMLEVRAERERLRAELELLQVELDAVNRYVAHCLDPPDGATTIPDVGPSDTTPDERRQP